MPRSQLAYRRRTAARQTQEIKGAFWYILGILAVICVAIYSSASLVANQRYIQLGKSIDCIERPSFDYFAFCSPQADGAACTLASQTRMQQFYEPIDYACAQFEPDRRFKFPVNNEPETLELAEVG